MLFQHFFLLGRGLKPAKQVFLWACGRNVVVTAHPTERDTCNHPAPALSSVPTLAPRAFPVVALSQLGIGKREKHKRNPCNAAEGWAMLYYLAPDSRSDVFSPCRGYVELQKQKELCIDWEKTAVRAVLVQTPAELSCRCCCLLDQPALGLQEKSSKFT